MKDDGKTSKAPITEAFGNWSNAKIVLMALLGGIIGQGVVWYTGQFYALFFLQSTLEGRRLHLLPADRMVADHWYRLLHRVRRAVGQDRPQADHPGGMPDGGTDVLPDLPQDLDQRQPAVGNGHRDREGAGGRGSKGCGDLFNPVGTGVFSAPCDLARDFLAKSSVKYDTVAGPAGSPVVIKVNGTDVPYTKPADSNAAATAALQGAGYPKPGANTTLVKMAHPFDIFRPQVAAIIGLLFVLVLFVTMVYGPIAAMLVELFPTRIRYTSMSLPYHIGNGWFGGLLPATLFAIVASTGDIYSGLWYPVIFALITVVIGFFFLPETKDVDINQVKLRFIVPLSTNRPRITPRPVLFSAGLADKLQHDLAPMRGGCGARSDRPPATCPARACRSAPECAVTWRSAWS